MNVNVYFRGRGSHSDQIVKSFCDQKCPERKLWCHILDPSEPIYNYKYGNAAGWEMNVKPGERLLHGPVSCLKTRKIYYPCDQFGCFVGCPCSLCQKSELHDMTSFEDHQLYHNAFHFGCDFCTEIFRVLPCYDYNKLVSNSSVWFIRNYVSCKSYVFFHKFDLVKMPKAAQLRCEECDMSFSEARNMYRHDRAKHVKKNHSCEDCGKQFSRTDNLERHRDIHRGIKEGLLECKYCFTKFRDFSSWDRHMGANLDEEGNGKDVCDECGSGFCSPKRLKLHKKNEHLECKDCNVKFTRKSLLVAHMSREKSTCDLCDSVYCNSRQLIIHKAASHQKDKIRCNQCGKGFTKKWFLERHQRGASKTVCRECDLTFCHKKQLIYISHVF